MFVYIVQAGVDGPVKIGFSKKLSARLASLNTGAFVGLRVLRTIEGTYDTERWFHERFAASWRKNEWFDFHPDMMTVMPPDADTLRVLIDEEDAELSDLREEMRRHILMVGTTLPSGSGVKAMQAKAAEVFNISHRRAVSYYQMTVRDPKAREVDRFRAVVRSLLIEHAEQLERQSAHIRQELKRTEVSVSVRKNRRELAQSRFDLTDAPITPRLRVTR